MKLFRLALVGCLALGLCAVARAQEGGKQGSNKDKIVGTWELVKDDTPNPAPPGTKVQFTKDGKVKLNIKLPDRTLSLEGSYKVDGDNLTITMKGPDGQQHSNTDTIGKLTDKQLVLKSGKEKKNVEFKKASK